MTSCLLLELNHQPLSEHKCHPLAVQRVAVCSAQAVSLSLSRQLRDGLFLLVRQELFTHTVLPLRSHLKRGEAKPTLPAG